MFEIPYYHDYISPQLAAALLRESRALGHGLSEVGKGGGLETAEALEFLSKLYVRTKSRLGKVLRQRALDRKFMDERVAACHAFNRELGRDWLDPTYATIVGLEDSDGRVVIGPLTANYARRGGKAVAPLPDFLQGPHVTLFGPPDSAKLAINAMNAYHRKLPTEPAIVAELLGKVSPMWGADDEDSKTPLRVDLVDAAMNLTACFEGTLELSEGNKHYALAGDHLSLPIKRFPGLALPCTFLFHEGNPIPLHLYDFALHLFRNWANPRALVFYVPKLENEEEAAYIHHMIATAEEMIQELHPSYELGTVRLMIVLENPRAILRAHEIMDALFPYFAGASLGWHDYLASTARVFKNDSNYRIPVKADPNIVIKYIKASHLLLAEAVGSRGGIKVGGMYGILPAAGSDSLQITLKGFIKDVITQMKRDLTGFWVAHPDFVRLGLALVEAWKRRQIGEARFLNELVTGLLEAKYHKEILGFIEGADIEGLDIDDPNYVRSLIVADIKESDFIPNNHPDEIRYNVFQSLQYLTDWLSGNGCVALPTIIDGIPVRVMDDLATAERSRWEVWHELHHGRFSTEEFIKIAHQEMNFIRRDLSDGKKIVQVKWDERTARWYPIALRLMLQLMTDPDPVEFATELLMPFTVDRVRSAEDPWQKVNELDPRKFALPHYVERYHHYFEICGVDRFARAMAENLVEDAKLAEEIILGFSPDEIIEAASFHGDIGQTKATLDARAAAEQAGVTQGDDLLEQGEAYRKKFGFKFLISAKGKSATELSAALHARMNNSPAQEIENARRALWEISEKRMTGGFRLALPKGLAGAAVAINYHHHTQVVNLGESVRGSAPVTDSTLFEIASLSKTFASAMALEYFRAQGIPLSTPVNELFARTSSPFRLKSPNQGWAESVTVEHLLSHSALNMHYVKGIPSDLPFPSVTDFLNGGHGYEPLQIIAEPGKEFHYSGGGFLVLEHLLESLSGKPIAELRNFPVSFDPETPCAAGYLDSGPVPGGHYNFPALAAGGFATAGDVARFLRNLTTAYQSLEGAPGISHDTACLMLHGSDKGCREFMGCDMGLGVFVAEAGPNKLAIHQGANEGFRALYIQCVQGPDAGKGFVVLANGDNKAVAAIAEMARALLQALKIEGIDFSRIPTEFDFSALSQEQIVNLGYKKLIFDAFLPSLPEAITEKGTLDPLADRNLVVGGKIISVSNQKFARAENLLSPHLPVFDPTLFGRQGKIMDSWETARHNPAGFDSLVIELAKPSSIRFVHLSTKFHDGNQAEQVRLSGWTGSAWKEFFHTPMAGHAHLEAELPHPTPVFSRIRVEIFPDGGLTRLGLFASPIPLSPGVRYADPIPKAKKPLTLSFHGKPLPMPNLASQAAGAVVESASNEHYGPAAQVISPYPPIHMFDGLESARSRKPGHHEEVVIRLARPGRIERVILDFTFFVNNNPLFVSLEGKSEGRWLVLAPKTKVKAFAGNEKEFLFQRPELFSHLRVTTYPDGGINRIKVLDSPA